MAFVILCVILLLYTEVLTRYDPDIKISAGYDIYNGVDRELYACDVYGNIAGIVVDVPAAWEGEFDGDVPGTCILSSRIDENFSYSGVLPTVKTSANQAYGGDVTGEANDAFRVNKVNGAYEINEAVKTIKTYVGGIQVSNWDDGYGDNRGSVQLRNLGGMVENTLGGIQVSNWDDAVEDNLGGVQLRNLGGMVENTLGGIQVSNWDNAVEDNLGGAQGGNWDDAEENERGGIQINDWDAIKNDLGGIQVNNLDDTVENNRGNKPGNNRDDAVSNGVAGGNWAEEAFSLSAILVLLIVVSVMKTVIGRKPKKKGHENRGKESLHAIHKEID